MKILLDTCVAVWCLDDFNKINSDCLTLLGDPSHVLYLSVASLWEMAIKIKKRNPDLPADLMAYLCGEFHPLNIRAAHCIRTMDLPQIHKDPFDRMIIAQALEEKIPVVTRDAVFAKYGIEVIWA